MPVRRGTGRNRVGPGLHAHLARALRPLALVRDPGDPAGARAASAGDALLGLRLRLLGEADRRRAFDRDALPPRPATPRRAALPRARPRPDSTSFEPLESRRLVPALVQRPARPARPGARPRLWRALVDRPPG